MPFKPVTLFRFFGFDVKADASWLFLAVFISWTLNSKVFPALLPGESIEIYQFMGLLTLALLIFSIIAHEVAHAVIAEYYHMPIQSIRLFVFGGVAEMKGEPSHAHGELLMAVAGPVMSLLLALFFQALAELAAPAGAALQTVLSYTGTINLYLALFNLVPAFPLDGGRMLRAWLWHRRGNLVSATRTASKLSAAFAYGMMAWGCQRLLHHDDLIGGIWLTLLGLFVFASSAYAVRQTESRALLDQEAVSRFMHAKAAAVPPHLSIGEIIETYAITHYQNDYPVVESGRVIGLLGLKDILRLDRGKWPWLHVATVMRPLDAGNSIRRDASAADALDTMQKNGRSTLIVISDHGGLEGIVEYRDLATFLQVTLQIDQSIPLSKSR